MGTSKEAKALETLFGAITSGSSALTDIAKKTIENGISSGLKIGSVEEAIKRMHDGVTVQLDGPKGPYAALSNNKQNQNKQAETEKTRKPGLT